MAVQTVSFPSEIGWIGVNHCQRRLTRIGIGYPTQQALISAMSGSDLTDSSSTAVERDGEMELVVDWDRADEWERELIDRFQRFACGEAVIFDDLEIDTSNWTRFEQRVYRACRRIPYGTTLSYRELAERAGSPRAYRAVGNVMARNRYPLVIPCHRVVAANGKLGGFSSPRGVNTKRQLLALEGILLDGQLKKRSGSKMSDKSGISGGATISGETRGDAKKRKRVLAVG